MITMESKPFGLDAQARIAALFRTCSPESFLTELGNYAPATSSERVAYHKYQGWALYDSGHYARSRLHLLTALRSSVRDSADRSLIRGLLGESYLRLGHFKRAERCV